MVIPGQQTAEIKKKRGKTVGRNAGEVAKDDREDQRHNKRLHDCPCRAKCSLLIARDEIPPHQQRQKIAELPEGMEIDSQPALVRPNVNLKTGRLAHCLAHQLSISLALTLP